jgi:hypothetical protein
MTHQARVADGERQGTECGYVPGVFLVALRRNEVGMFGKLVPLFHDI